jgi:hypothetical protein
MLTTPYDLEAWGVAAAIMSQREPRAAVARGANPGIFEQF